jgi:quinone-modifying oxidoreductase subunit QmoC
MVWVQWGLKDLAMGNSSIWLCHQCGICSTYCPRDAGPSEVMAALRDYSITHYAAPSFMGRALRSPGYLPLLLAIPTAIFLAVLAGLGQPSGLPEGPIVFSKFMPILAIEIIFLAALALSTAGAAVSAHRYWTSMRKHMGRNGSSSATALLPTILGILRHRWFRQCLEQPAGTRRSHKEHLRKTHLAIFYGFAGSTITTVSVAVLLYFFGVHTPLDLGHPVKILGNVSGALILGALAVFTWRRIVDGTDAGKSTYSDWLFLSVLFLTVLTGFLSEISRIADIAALAYPVYFVHLVVVFFLLVYIPYSKFAHIGYRTLAMLYEGPQARAANDSKNTDQNQVEA